MNSNEGYAATAGEDWMRPKLCDEALRVGRILTALAPLEPEVHGLVSLMEIQASRTPARVGSDGEPILLLEQNRALWDHLLIRRGVESLERVYALGGGGGLYALQAAIAACHGVALTASETDWQRIAALYEKLAKLTGSPVVEVNRAVAVAMSVGPLPALKVIDAIISDPALQNYHLLWSVRGDILARLGRNEQARVEFERAASLAWISTELDSANAEFAK
jgi:RNA polymerase sigma-70 factor (ECF subfamily)